MDGGRGACMYNGWGVEGEGGTVCLTEHMIVYRTKSVRVRDSTQEPLANSRTLKFCRILVCI